MVGADAFLHQTRRGGKHHVGGHGTDQDRVQFGSGNASLRKSGARGLDGHVRSGDVGSRYVTLFYAGSLDDPLMIRLDQFLEVGVRKNPGRSVTTEGGDFGSKRAQFP
jgi:hypothetical protein